MNKTIEITFEHRESPQRLILQLSGSKSIFFVANAIQYLDG